MVVVGAGVVVVVVGAGVVVVVVVVVVVGAAVVVVVVGADVVVGGGVVSVGALAGGPDKPRIGDAGLVDADSPSSPSVCGSSQASSAMP